jgi:predicted nuclease with TOPRIM domain
MKKMRTVHICSKEAEIATMAEKLTQIEKKVDHINEKMDKFIDTADSKYATKHEVAESLKHLEETRTIALANLEKDILDNKTWIMIILDWIAKYGPILAIIAYVVLKTPGYAP